MGVTTGISWTDHTANFWFGCMKVSPGCTNCYAETTVTGRMRLPVWGPPKTTERKRAKGVWREVRRWNDAARAAGVRRRMFVSSLSDIFERHPQVEAWRAEALALLEELTFLDIQLLTKRPELVRSMVPRAWLEGRWPRHIWIGTTVEDVPRARERIPELLALTEAPIRFLSMEPLLESVPLRALRPKDPCSGCGEHAVVWNVLRGTARCTRCGVSVDPPAPGCADWVIVGGESGSEARPFDVAWAEEILAECAFEGVAAFMKQMGDRAILSERSSAAPWTRGGSIWLEANTRRLRGLGHHGAEPSLWPESFRTQTFPTVLRAA